jgi:hypothetical protein
VAFLSDLLALHPDSAAKIGPGVRSFSVRPDGYGKRCFWLTRTDGTETDWSFVSCLRPPSTARDLAGALRNAIRPQIVAFRDALAFPRRCPVSGERLYRDGCHVDHVVPFDTLMRSFLANEGLAADSVALHPGKDGSTQAPGLVDAALERRWCEYHADWAELRAVSASFNLGRGKK